MFKFLRNKLIEWLNYEPPTTEIMPFDFSRLKYEIRPGDVLLIAGRSRVSSVIRTLTQSPWTHAALFIGRMIDFEDDELENLLRSKADFKSNTRLIVEDLINQGTVVNPLTIYRNHHIRICRPIGITPSDVHIVLKYAIKAIGQPYNVKQLFDLMRFLLPWTILPRRWGSNLFRTSTGEPESGICSSLIAEAFSSVQFPILPFITADKNNQLEVFQRNPFLLTPKDFDYSPYFEIIKYPLFNPEEPLPYYRRLPWTKSGMLHQEREVLASPKLKRKKIKLFGRREEEKNIEEKKEDTKKNHSDGSD